MSREKLISDILIKQEINLFDPEYLENWPEFDLLKTTDQDKDFHAEGDVLTHTGMVLQECNSIVDKASQANILSEQECQIIKLGCLFHDIAKSRTTLYDENYGHIIAPGHERKGGIQTRYILNHISGPMRRDIADLVSTHHLVKRSVKNIDLPKDQGLANLRQLSCRANTKLLYYLELADMQGRVCIDQDKQIEIVELFKMLCEESKIFGASWQNFINLNDLSNITFNNEFLAQYAIKECYRQQLLGTITNQWHAISFCHGLAEKSARAEIIITVGASGSGKSLKIDSLPTSYERISSDAIRKELYGSEDIQGDPGTVFQMCQERLRQVLRKQGKAVIDATNIVPDLRSKFTTLCHEYGAYVHYWVWDITLPELLKRNKQRARFVPTEVIERQTAKFEWPQPEEYHEITVFENQDEKIDHYRPRWHAG